jgi:hypothetical protein
MEAKKCRCTPVRSKINPNFVMARECGPPKCHPRKSRRTLDDFFLNFNRRSDFTWVARIHGP